MCIAEDGGIFKRPLDDTRNSSDFPFMKLDRLGQLPELFNLVTRIASSHGMRTKARMNSMLT